MGHFCAAQRRRPQVTTPEQVAAMFQKVLADTKDYWRTWLKQCRYQGRWREMVQRSALALKLLTYAPTGAVVAAPTTSLPEGIGGERNWDYRFTWLRDAGLTLQSLSMLGFEEKPMPSRTGCWRAFSSSSRIAHPTHVHHSWGHEMPEILLDHLDGYRQSRPVRIGNGAARQLQMDVSGELFDAFFLLVEQRGLYYRGWEQIRRIMEWLSKNWQTLDKGIWEVRGGRPGLPALPGDVLGGLRSHHPHGAPGNACSPGAVAPVRDSHLQGNHGQGLERGKAELCAVLWR